MYIVCITRFEAEMRRVREFGGGDTKIIPAPYPNGYSLNSIIPTTSGKNFR